MSRKASRLLDAAEKAAKKAKKSRPADQQFTLPAGKLRKLEKHSTYLVTSAQNNTPVNPAFFSALRHYADAHGARLLVVPIRYKNPTSSRSPQEDDVDRPDYWWPEELHPYLVENRVQLHRRLRVLGDLRIAATAANPLSGLDAVAGDSSLLIGHGQLRMHCVPTPHGKLPRILHTTGSVSARNYSRTASGFRAEFHHVAGAVLVICTGDVFHLRQIVWSEKKRCFHDLRERWGRKGFERYEPIAALVTGDEHCLWADARVAEATYGPGGIVDVLQPPVIVRHDVLDGYAVSRFHDGDLLEQFVKHTVGGQALEDELLGMARWLDKTTPEGVENVIVASNHNDRVRQWLKRSSPLADPWNAGLYHELMGEVLRRIELGEGGAKSKDPLAIWADMRGLPKCKTRFLGRNDSYRVRGIELGFHGDVGVHGGRGSLATFAKVAPKTVIGHRHTPAILHGCWQVGTSGPTDPTYSRGPNAGMHSHCIVHQTGKRQIINILGGSWR